MKGLRQGGGLHLPFSKEIGGISALMGAAIVAAILLLPSGLAIGQEGSGSDIVDPSNIFAPFKTETGTVQTVKGPNCTHPDNGALGADVCNTSNTFMTTNFGTAFGNGQKCETCHQPQLGWSITPAFLDDRFSDTHGTAEQFRVNDTASDPSVCGAPTATTTQAQNAANVNACVTSMSLAQKQTSYKLFVDLSIHRIAIKDNKTLDDFTVTGTSKSVDGTISFGQIPVPPGQDSQQPCALQVAPAPPSTTGCLQTVPVFRRPLLTVNTFFDSSVLWDGRQNVCVEPTPAPGVCPAGPSQPIRTPLLVAQVSGAAQTLPLSAPPTLDQEKMAAHFMTGLFTAMIRDDKAGSLNVHGAHGGPQFLADMASGKATPPCTPLVEASVANSGEGMPPPACAAPGPGSSGPKSASPPNGRGFNLYIAFLPKNLQAGADTPAGIQAIFAFCDDETARAKAGGNPTRIAIACGENIFDNHPVNDPVVGRDTSGSPPSGSFGSSAPPNARCTSCHSAQDVGTNPLPAFILPYTPGGGIAQNPSLFVGGKTLASDDTFCASNPTDPFCKSQTFNLPEFKKRTEMLPLYTLTQNGPGGSSIQLTDPGQALITHKFANAGAQKPPQLRDLAPRGPFFHNGAAEDLNQLVDFYNQNFSIGLTDRQHSDLVQFLLAL